MSKNQSYRVEIEFSSKIQSDEETMEIAQNIANAIVHAANDGKGIAPTESDAYTMIVRVTPQYLNKTIIEHTV